MSRLLVIILLFCLVFHKRMPFVFNFYGWKTWKELYNDVFSVVCFTYPHDQWTKTLAAQGKPVYEYYFSRENGEIGTNHSGEMIYAYRNVPRTKNYNERDYELEEIMSSYWLNFVKYGNPNGKDTNGNELLKWQTTTESGGLLMEFGNTCQMVEDPFGYMYEYFYDKQSLMFIEYYKDNVFS